MQTFNDKTNPFSAINFPDEVFIIKRLFSKKPNDHLISLLELMSNSFDKGKLEGSVNSINEYYDEAIVLKNAILVYNQYKRYIVDYYDRKLLSFLISLRESFMTLDLKEDQDLNLAILQKFVDDVIGDNKIDDSEVELAKTICKTFSVDVTEFTSILSHKILLLQNDMINGLYNESESKLELIKKFYMIANKLNHKYDLQQAFKFINSYNQYSISNQLRLSGLNLNIGFGSMTNYELYNVFNVKYGKIKKSGGSMTVDLAFGKLYNYGSAYLLIKTYGISDSFTGESTVLMFNEIKEYGTGIFNNTNEQYFWYKVKGERNSHIISGFDEQSIYDYIAKFNSLIDNPNNFNSITNKEKGEKRNTSSEKENNIDDSKNEVNINYLDELNSLIGLSNVKQQILSLVNLIKAQNLRKTKNLKVVNVSLHSVFSGPPGTGKTTVARLYAGILKELGVLKKGHLIEVDRSELVAGYLGQTAIKTEEIITKALDGVLFIDEAYSLTSSSSDSYGEEAVNVLLKRMEDERDRLVVIVAGYTSEMESFINSNPGLQSRFTRYIEFENYTSIELTQIFELLIQKNEYKLDELAKEKLLNHFELIISSGKEDFGNGRYVRNLFEKVIQEHANQIAALSNPTDEDLVLITEKQISI
jgi:SpoVK/Ycf46/Vps4 family AAA+-type ATPase